LEIRQCIEFKIIEYQVLGISEYYEVSKKREGVLESMLVSHMTFPSVLDLYKKFWNY
jgi:hypothetical protein